MAEAQVHQGSRLRWAATRQRAEQNRASLRTSGSSHSSQCSHFRSQNARSTNGLSRPCRAIRRESALAHLGRHVAGASPILLGRVNSPQQTAQIRVSSLG
jgi:hypothetical protein